MDKKIIYSAEFPDGKEVDLTSEEVAAAKEKTKNGEKYMKDFSAAIDTRKAAKISAAEKLKELGLTDDEIDAIFDVQLVY